MNTPITYRFGEFRLDPAARELWQGGQRLESPRMIFDGLAFLVENRGRAVSRDELIAAVWGRPHVEDIQVTQLVMRLRRAIGDDSHEPRFIRTVSGFGYRWVAETEEFPGRGVNVTTGIIEPPSLADLAATPSTPAQRATGASLASTALEFRHRRPLFLALLAGALLVFALLQLGRHRDQLTAPLPREPGEAIAVLPLEIDAPADTEAGWIRLGVMDLIAERLRDSGLPVPPSDSVVSALHAGVGLPEAKRLAALRRTLGAGILIQGKATQAAGGWTIELVASTAASDGRRRVESNPSEIIAAADQATGLLLAALGQEARAPGAQDEALSELLQRARAAALALELETARAILAQASESLRGEPEVRYELAWVEYRAGRLDEAEELLIELLEDPILATRTRLRAAALAHRGVVTARKQDNFGVAMPYFDAAVAALDEEPWAPELGPTLAMRGVAHVFLNDFNAAARDLGQARSRFQVSGDRLGLARFHNYFGGLELERRRPIDALPHFRAAIDISQSFGHIDWLRGNLIGLLVGQVQLLDWPGALETSERLWVLRERIQDPVWHNQIKVSHATVLLAFGRHGEAEGILADAAQAESGLPPHAVRESEQARARLAWQHGRAAQAFRAAAKALELWPPHDNPAAQERTGLALLHQRASIASGQAVPATRTLSTTARPVGDRGREATDTAAIEEDPAYLVARAEWAAHGNDHDEAERLFRKAAANAEHWPVPTTLVMVADAYVRWLLGQDRVPEALAQAGRVAGWAEHDYDSALLQVAVFHASAQHEAWTIALRRAQGLAGERRIPAGLLVPPT